MLKSMYPASLRPFSPTWVHCTPVSRAALIVAALAVAVILLVLRKIPDVRGGCELVKPAYDSGMLRELPMRIQCWSARNFPSNLNAGPTPE